MKCRACLGEHAPWVRCEVAARISGIGLSQPAKVVDAVVDTPKPLVVDARTKDRHRKTEERREYLRVKQRESRARRAT